MYIKVKIFQQFQSILQTEFKGTHTLYFSSSLYIINQKPVIPRSHFHCITIWEAHSSG